MTAGAEVKDMFASIADRYDLANSALSMGIHYLWRNKLVGMLPDLRGTNSLALDLCTGTGDLLKPLTTKCDRVVGADFCLPMLKAGLHKASGTPLLQADALRLPFASESMDLVTVAFGVRNFENLNSGLSEISRVLKPGAYLAVLEFGQPSFSPWRVIYDSYSKYFMPIIGGLITGNRQAYTYLPQTAKNFPCRQDFCNILESCGFRDCKVFSLNWGIAYIYLSRKG